MKSRRRLFSFLVLNVIVSVVTTLAVLYYMVGFYPASAERTTNALPINSGGDAGAPSDNDFGTSSNGAQAAGQFEIARIVGAGDLASERIEIHHIGESQVSMAGWRLRDEDGNVYLFANITVIGDGSFFLFTKAGESDTVFEKFWGLEEAIWESGEIATLEDPSGNPQATYRVP